MTGLGPRPSSAKPARMHFPAWNLLGPTAPTPAPSRTGCKASAAGVSRCRSTAAVISGATGWRKSLRLPGHPAPVGGGADIRSAVPLAPPRPRL
jgi:hypothetical protein